MEQINFLGIPVSVMSEQDMDAERETQAPHLYLVSRVQDEPPGAALPGFEQFVARRQRTLCERCQAVCYFDPKQFDSMRGMNLTIVCLPCHVDELRRKKQS